MLCCVDDKGQIHEDRRERTVFAFTLHLVIERSAQATAHALLLTASRTLPPLQPGAPQLLLQLLHCLAHARHHAVVQPVLLRVLCHAALARLVRALAAAHTATVRVWPTRVHPVLGDWSEGERGREGKTERGREGKTERGREGKTERGREGEREGGKGGERESGRDGKTERGREGERERGREGERERRREGERERRRKEI